jgi:2-polyprenyl-3-methyl-5-hydroxy-6-metoxy-1,4-benzoquinol methylase
LAWVKGPAVLDVGCAGHAGRVDHPEWLHGRLRQNFSWVWGIDKDPSNVRALQDQGFTNVEVADAQSFDLKERFDSVVAGELIEHLERPGDFLTCAARHLKLGGRIVISTPYPFAIHHFVYALYRFPKTCSNAEHTIWLCPTTLGEMARRAELQVVHWELVSLEQPTESGKYRTFLKLLKLFGWVLPDRLRNNTMLAVLEARP